ncbi:hypothetical protein [Streptomyces sp. V4I23]|uniref:hypothetical protein n=1 Tax=Streptomyces sp. V4I23 TaxID=3042282 RepID=UPI0027D887BA|nr:hypothetical protein [Streptomyces sp. V4I23]
MTYHADVEFLELCNPALIERNAQEYRRLHRLLESSDTAFLKAIRTQWVSEANDLYEKRLREAESLATHLSSAFRTTWKSLVDYADAVERAKSRFEDGRSSEAALSEVMSRVAEPVTETAQRRGTDAPVGGPAQADRRTRLVRRNHRGRRRDPGRG